LRREPAFVRRDESREASCENSWVGALLSVSRDSTLGASRLKRRSYNA